MNTPQPPEPPQWALNLVAELRPISAMIATSVARQKREQAGLLRIVMRHYETCHAQSERDETRRLLVELLGAVTSKGAPDTSSPIMWSGSPDQNHRMYDAIDDVRAHLEATK